MQAMQHSFICVITLDLGWEVEVWLFESVGDLLSDLLLELLPGLLLAQGEANTFKYKLIQYIDINLDNYKIQLLLQLESYNSCCTFHLVKCRLNKSCESSRATNSD